MSKYTPPLVAITDPCQHLKIRLNPDGSLTREPIFPLTNPNPNDLTSPVRSKDIPINASTNTSLRIFLPSSVRHKIPLVVYFHGGGFVFASPATSIFHEYCSALALQLPALVVSVDYRLAPEHRLPAAYDDSMEALNWVKTLDDEWLRDYADYDNCFLMGDSAGGNIAYHVGLRASFQVEALNPLNIRGLILALPFFGGVQRSESEISMVNDHVIPPIVTDLLWDLSLPIGADRDHEYSNPMVDGGSKGLDKIRELGWKVLLSGWYGDPLIDRQVALVELMKQKGIEVEGVFREGGFHGKDVFDLYEAKKDGLSVLMNFIRSS